MKVIIGHDRKQDEILVQTSSHKSDTMSQGKSHIQGLIYEAT